MSGARATVRLLGTVALLIVVAGCSESGAAGLNVVTEGQHRLDGDVPGGLLVAGGSVTVTGAGRVRGPVWIVGGSLELDGRVDGDLSILGGEAVLGSAAVISGNLNLGGGEASGLEGARVDGQVTDQLGLEMPLTPGWQRQQSIETQLLFAAAQTLVLALLAALVALIVPRPLRRVEETVSGQSAVSLALGVLGGLVILPLIVFMAFTVVLIPIALIGLLLFGLAVVYGWTATGSALLRRLVPPARRWPAPLIAGVGAGALSVVAQLTALVPIAGAAAVLGLAVIGLGAVLFTRFGTRSAAPARS
jgi:cytoskeletal protein CcmA (bactofilin family)